MNQDLAQTIGGIIAEAPDYWLASACLMLKSVPPDTAQEAVLQKIPATNNGDLAGLMRDAVKLASGNMSWESLGWMIDATQKTYVHWRLKHGVEFLWAGPSPANAIPARRIDQALYDLIANAKRDILLVTFAAVKIERLTNEILKAVGRGIRVRLVLEFEQSSEGQLRYDALNAFPEALARTVEVYHWPIENRERNQSGRPGKLHAKFAVIDDVALVSSANLTDDAFNRNLEIGVMLRDASFISAANAYVEGLIAESVLQRFF